MENRPAEVVPPPRGGRSEILARVVGLAAGAARAVRTYALIAAAAAAVIGVYLFRNGVPPGDGQLAVRLIALAAAAAPPAVLLFAAVTLKALAELPERVRSIPREAGERAEELRRLRDRARAARTRGGLRSLPRTLWQLVRLGGSSRELLTPYAGVLPLVRLPFLGWSVAAAVAAGFEILIAAILLVALLVGA